MAIKLVLALVLLVLGGGLLALAWHLRRRWRHITETPTSACGALSQGFVEVKGTSTPAPGGQPLRAPFSGTPCVHWRYVIEEERTRPVVHSTKSGTTTRTERRWVKVNEESSPEPFGVRDVTGVALVDASGGEVSAPVVKTFSSGMFRDPPAAVLALLQGRGIPWEGIFGVNKTMRYTERVLPEGLPLYVQGTAVPGPDQRLVIRKVDGAPFLVSTKSEESLVRRYAAGAAASLLVGVGALALAGWILLGGLA